MIPSKIVIVIIIIIKGWWHRQQLATTLAGSGLKFYGLDSPMKMIMRPASRYAAGAISILLAIIERRAASNPSGAMMRIGLCTINFRAQKRPNAISYQEKKVDILRRILHIS